ncbi:MAG: hypothetical protein OXE42_13360 [Gammaproteobacteria bacterium]|nr:hypothetical protein [Gammaproteobacteria bacterium]
MTRDRKQHYRTPAGAAPVGAGGDAAGDRHSLSPETTGPGNHSPREPYSKHTAGNIRRQYYE